jgi:hypothetical protein
MTIQQNLDRSRRPLPLPRVERYIRDRSQWDGLSSDQFQDLLAQSLCYYGIANDRSLIDPMASLMRRAAIVLSANRREQAYANVREIVRSTGKPLCYALLPAVEHEPVPEIAATATIDFVSLSPMTDKGRPLGLIEALELIRIGAAACPGGIFGGLVAMGDERFRADLERMKPRLSRTDVKGAARCGTDQIWDCEVQFWLDWAEELMPTQDEDETAGMLGLVASALFNVYAHARARDVRRPERQFPANAHREPVKILQSWSLDEYTQLVAPRLYALEEAEHPPKVFSPVLERWGLPPRAPWSERFRP